MVFTETELVIEDEASADTVVDETTVVTEHKRKKKRASILAELPRIDVIHDLDDVENSVRMTVPPQNRLVQKPTINSILFLLRFKFCIIFALSMRAHAVSSISPLRQNLRNRLKKVSPH